VTATDDARPPVDLDLLADYLEGLLTGAEAQRVDELVTYEPQWAATAARLRAALPAVHENLLGLAEPMPPDVLDRVLAALPVAGPSTPPARADGSHPAPATRPSPPPAPGRGAPPAGPSRSAPPGRPTRGNRRRRLSTGAIGLALIVVVLGIGSAIGFGLSQSAKSTSNAGSAAGAPDNGAPHSLDSYRAAIDARSLPRTESGLDYGPTFAALSSGGGVPPRQPTPAAPQATHGSEGDSSTPPPAQFNTGPLSRLGGTAALQDCLAGVAARLGSLPMSVDYARYMGQPALIVRLTNGSIAAVAPDCSATNPDILAVSGG
jgi:hypothetical protein